MKYLINITVLSLTILLLVGCFEKNIPPQNDSVKEKLILDLSGRWKFSPGDQVEWKDEKFDDSKWEKIYAPSSWEDQGFHGYDGYAWYRNSFRLIPDIINKDLYLVLGYVDDVDQTFINGKLIGISGGFPNSHRTAYGNLVGVSDDIPNSYRTAYNAFRKYYIPKEYLNKDGENVIAVRIFDDELDGGIMSGKIGLYTFEGGFEPDINLSGIWDFKIGDDSSFLKNNKIDSTVDKLMVPAHWDVQGYQDYNGFAWYRKIFYLPKELDNESMILLLGKIDDIDQAFVNGIPVGSTGNWNFRDFPIDFNSNEEYLTNRVYSVPQKLLKYGKTNTVVVRVFDGFKEGGIYDGSVGLIKQSNYKKYLGKK